MAHIGSWGTPDFGITEWISDILGGSRDPVTGGSQIFSSGTSQPNLVTSGTDNPWAGDIVSQPTYQSTGGTVEGLTTDANNNPVATNTISPEQQAIIDQQNAIRADIGSSWDNYTNSLNQMLNTGLTGQRAAQEGIVGSQFTSGMAGLTGQRDIGLHDLGQERGAVKTRQSKNLRDLSGNISNMFRAGNVMLGSMGSGDSSAANQYSYALTKLGSQRRSDIMGQSATSLNEIASREWKMNSIFNTETNKLKADRDQKILGVAQWFSESQNKLREAISKGELNKSIDLNNLAKTLLDQGMMKLQNAEIEYANRSSALDSWAMTNSENLAQLKQNMQGVGAYKAPNPQYSAFSGSPMVDARGNLNLPIGYGTSEEDKRFT